MYWRNEQLLHTPPAADELPGRLAALCRFADAARALFYWSLLRDRYWLAQYLSVSSILSKAPAKYTRSFLLSETDDNDLTYFVIYQLEVVRRAIESLQAYLGRKADESRGLEVMLGRSSRLNQRQRLILQDALRDPGEPFTIGTQSRRYRVTYQSARTDLLGLETLGLMTKQRIGRMFVFHAVPDLTREMGRRG